MKNIAFLVLACLMVLALPKVARADGDFYLSSGFQVNPDFNSGSAYGYGYSTNAVATSISSGISYNLDPKAGTAHLYAYVTISGNFGDPTANNPWYDLLEEDGLHTFNSFNQTQVTWDGNTYEFNDVVNLTNSSHFYLWRNDEHTEMNGDFFSNANGEGVVPIQSMSSYNVYEPGHPEWLPDWQVHISSEWLITTGYTMIPTPGPLALLGVAGIVGRRRRHQH